MYERLTFLISKMQFWTDVMDSQVWLIFQKTRYCENAGDMQKILKNATITDIHIYWEMQYVIFLLFLKQVKWFW